MPPFALPPLLHHRVVAERPRRGGLTPAHLLSAACAGAAHAATRTRPLPGPPLAQHSQLLLHLSISARPAEPSVRGAVHRSRLIHVSYMMYEYTQV